ncbi:hypothetical protein BLA60_13700 [Actinophytocola xinjiangensis]|uniref:SD-repeat containing protein B domain-containing protein n=1 Tax=Actinophytocola xinjiangensis TaxID=485602 RepID=A0A7Z0WMZ2_9PSEU|nr:hypothetical protein BLA60_13700 [Actinophytocola xinjiangensis]
MEVRVDFDQDRYRTGETMSIRFEVVNHGTAPQGVSVWQPWSGENRISTDYESWGRFTDGVDIPAGGSVAVTVTGRSAIAGATVGVLDGILFPSGGGDQLGEFHHEVPITPTYGRLGGIAYGDENGNARFDAGEALAGVTVTLSNSYVNDDLYTTTTGADGSFSLAGLPTVRMFLSAQAPDGWQIGYRMVTVAEENDDLLLRATRPLTGLSVSLEFTQDTYRPGDLASVRISLVNRSGRDLVGIVANCNRAGNSHSLTGRTAGWGALTGDGVTIPARSTLDLTVTETVPQAAFGTGRVTVACDFSYPGVEGDNPSDGDWARVPGGLGTVTGDVRHGEQGVAGVRLVLVTDDRCPILGTTTSDAQGRFTFTEVPAGEHQLYIFPPKGWTVSGQNPTRLGVQADATSRLGLSVAPGSSSAAPKLPAQPRDCDAAPAPRPRPAPAGLASTGANVGGLLVFGLGALTVGIAGIRLTRRRAS